MEEKSEAKQLPWLVALLVYHWWAFWLWLYHQSLVHVYNLRQCQHCGGYFHKVANDSATTCQACFLEGWRSYSAGE